MISSSHAGVRILSRKQRRRSAKIDADRSQHDPLVLAAEQLAEAEGLRQNKDLRRAKRQCEQLLKDHPDYVGALHTLGNIFYDLEQFDKAFVPLAHANALCPRNCKILLSFGRVNLQLGREEMAHTLLKQALEIDPDNVGVLNTLEKLYRHLGDFERALTAAIRLHELDRAAWHPRLSMAIYYVQLGELEQATVICETLIREGLITTGLVEVMCQLPKHSTSPQLLRYIDSIQVETEDQIEEQKYFRGQALHNLGRYEEALDQIRAANVVNREDRLSVWHAEASFRDEILEGVRRMKISERRREEKCNQPISLFIVGAPRSGKTTLEQMLRRQPEIVQGFESGIVDSSIARVLSLSQRPSMPSPEGMSPSLQAALLRTYQGELAARIGEARVYTVTGPSLAEHIATFASSNPNCRFIFLQRNPDDLALRIFMKKFYSASISYANDLGTIREFIQWHRKLSEICVEKMPDRTLVIDYDEMVENPKETVQKVCKICDIESNSALVPIPGDDRGVSKPYMHLLRGIELQ